jgi:pyruvate kinase
MAEIQRKPARTKLWRDLRVGESFSVDAGRITIKVEEQKGRRCRLRFELDETIQVDKPAKLNEE